ncbi:Ankyrin repeats (3 copies) [compost metagenome]
MNISKIIADKDLQSYYSFINEVDINQLNDSSQNLLHIAIANENNEVAQDLIKRGININAQDFKGQTPLHFAAAYNNFFVAKNLVENGAEVNVRDVYGNTPLWTAVFNGQRIKYYDVVILLVDSKADVNNTNDVNKTPLDIAKQLGYQDLIEILEKGK